MYNKTIVDLKELKSLMLKLFDNQKKIEDITDEENEKYENIISYLCILLKKLQVTSDEEYILFKHLNESINIEDLHDSFNNIFCDYNGNFDYLESKTYLNSAFCQLIKIFESNNIFVDVKIIDNNDVKLDEIILNIQNQFTNIDEKLNGKNYREVNTCCKSLVESVCKNILLNEKKYSSKDINKMKFGKLVNETLSLLNIKGTVTDDKELKNVVSKINSIVSSINEVRNFYSSAHGYDYKLENKAVRLSHHHYKAIVDSSKTVCNFIIGSYKYYIDKNM